MGVHRNIDYDRYPKQGALKGFRTLVYFHYNLAHEPVAGTIIRADVEDPCQTIILLDDGRVVLGSECHHAPQELTPTGQLQLVGEAAIVAASINK